jgi:hypothetical protein
MTGPNSHLGGGQVFQVNGCGTDNRTIPIYPAITQKTESIQIEAQNLPRKMLQPYYTIRSSLLSQSSYVGGESSKSFSSVMAVVDKQYAGGDFIFFGQSAQSFRITRPTTISSITTSIHDPDGSFAHVNDDSAIIYSVRKNITANTNIIQTILNDKNEKKSNM